MDVLRALLLTIVALLTAASPAAAAELKIATLAPDGSSWMEEVRRANDVITARTDGRVKLRFYPGGSMGNDQAMLRKIRIGQLHGAAVMSGALAEVETDLELYSRPLAFRSYDEVDRVRAALDGELARRLEQAGYVSFGFVEGGFAYLMSIRPTRSLADLKGQKAWIPEGDLVGQAILEAAGLTPVPLPLSDVLTGLQTGLIDAVAGPPVGAVALQWFTKVRYLTEIPILYTYGALVLDRRAFDRISPADQAIVRGVLADTMTALDRRARQENARALEALQRQGVQRIVPDAAATAGWERVAVRANQLLEDRLDVDPTLTGRMKQLLEAIRAEPTGTDG
jgi:TRAP-type C4-dicarboxylate transport system substrate-binding protein